jgi:hypothetical protein
MHSSPPRTPVWINVSRSIPCALRTEPVRRCCATVTFS